MTPPTLFTTRPRIFVALLLSMIVGCGEATGPVGTIEGTVRYRGKPVTVGTILFQDPVTKLGGSSPLDDLGRFHVKIPIPVGEYHVAVLPPDPPPPESGKPDVRGPVPEKYQVPEQGALRYAVKEGANEIDFDLE